MCGMNVMYVKKTLAGIYKCGKQPIMGGFKCQMRFVFASMKVANTGNENLKKALG